MVKCLRNQLFLEGCDGLSSLGGGQQLVPPEQNRHGESLPPHCEGTRKRCSFSDLK